MYFGLKTVSSEISNCTFTTTLRPCHWNYPKYSKSLCMSSCFPRQVLGRRDYTTYLLSVFPVTEISIGKKY